MASVGGVTCTFVKGDAPAKKEEVDVWRSVGIDGYGAQVLGLGDARAEFRAVFFSSALGVASWVGSIEALQGTVVTVVNDWGTSYSILIVHIDQPKRQVVKDPGIPALAARAELVIHGVTI